jgi:predicted deacetylase
MRFAIRDDDTNFFTSPEEIEFCYKQTWDVCPPSLSVIPFVQGNWRQWQDEFYGTGKITDWQAWEKDDEVHPIHENTKLVAFLKEKVAEGKVALTIHGVNHRNTDKQRQPLANNLIHYAEFYTDRDLTDKLKEGKAYLEKLFGQSFTVFTPPQNAITKEGYKAIVNNNLGLVGGGLPFLSRQKTLRWFGELMMWSFFRASNRNQYYPHVINLGRRKEIMVHFPLQEVTHLEDLIKAFDFVKAMNGDFILSTHYHGFPVQHRSYKNKIMKNVYDEFFEYVAKSDVQFCTVNQMLS